MKGHWCACFGLLGTSPLGFKARVGSLIFSWWRCTCYTFPDIGLWCDLSSMYLWAGIGGTQKWDLLGHVQSVRSARRSTDWAMPARLILTFYNGWMFSLPHFQFQSVNISTILTFKLNKCVYLETCFLAIAWNTSGMESSVNKQICLNCVLFLHCVIVQYVYCLSNEATQDVFHTFSN